MKTSSNWNKLRAKQEKEAVRKVADSKIGDKRKVKKTGQKPARGVPLRTPLTKMAQIQRIRESQQRGQPSAPLQDEKDSPMARAGKIIAMDCEFVGVGEEGAQSELARVSIVNFYGETVYDTFVKPQSAVTDWRTWVSGVSPSDMKLAVPFKEAQQKVSEILNGRVLVGHAIKNDLEALFLNHPRSMIRDTSKHVPYRKEYAAGKTPSLKKLSAHVLKRSIQEGRHSSVEDAKTTMDLYKFDRKRFEELSRNKCSPK